MANGNDHGYLAHDDDDYDDSVGGRSNSDKYADDDKTAVQ